MTGASRGIGRATARLLAQQGARVALCARTPDALESLAAELPGAASVHVCDITDAAQVAEMVPAVLSALGGQVSIVVNNAGLFPLAPIEHTSPALFEATMQANLLAPYRLVHALLPAMRERRAGHIVSIGSVADRHIFGGNGAYAASKFGARALHEVLRTELAGSGVRATLVSPAPTDTPIWDPIDPDNTPGFPPRASMLRADDVADAVLWAVTRPAHVNIDELRLSRA